ncbi:MAG TPA: hypothetical protein VHT71_25105 [Methylomirabilota bacterium]|nr:hypothetical protein [Methylomirabilota bacterium]
MSASTDRATLEFQRLASVRARRSRRQRSIAAAMVGVGVAIFVISGLVARRLPGPTPIDLARQVLGLDVGALLTAPAASEARGSVATIELDTRIVRLSSGFLGLISIPLLVTPQTLIVVGNKEGGFGDLRLGERVVATYQVGAEGLEATRIELVPLPRAPEE